MQRTSALLEGQSLLAWGEAAEAGVDGSTHCSDAPPAALLAPVWISVLGMPEAGLVTALLAALIFMRHDANIRRIVTGEEPRIGHKG